MPHLFNNFMFIYKNKLQLKVIILLLLPMSLNQLTAQVSLQPNTVKNVYFITTKNWFYRH